ncbi:MAG: enoyl-CoA hydratase/isomerase family protein [Myxococcales bacterium]|nr:MAG: enoyl-CoA hydratase/isomerase family protein [Myxococcales bacterium]
MAESDILVAEDGECMVWTLNRPAQSNALSQAMLNQMHDLALELGSKHAPRALIITGAGGRAFCAGADLKERLSMSESDVSDFLSLLRETFTLIDRAPVPTVAAINGAALGGGLELALACDFRVAIDGIKLGLPETRLAIIPGAGGTQRLSRVVGLQMAKRMILSAEPVESAEAKRRGLVDELALADLNVVDAARAWLAPILQNGPIAIAAALEAVDSSYDVDLEQGLDIEAACYKRTLSSQDRLEALRAFAEKRKAQFKGQ